MLGMVSFSNPVVIALMIGWIMSVVLHELAHGVVAHLGGDYTIRERGGLTLNPFQYIDPVYSLLMPLIFLAMGGLPLPGGVTFVRTDLLRTRGWRTAVSLAGPATNLLIFVLLVIPLHPKVGWVHPPPDLASWTPGEQFLGGMATLQFLSVCINLIPCPPLDGFGAIAPYLDRKTLETTSNPSFRNGAMLVLFGLLWVVPAIVETMAAGENSLLRSAGFGDRMSGSIVDVLGRVFNG